MIRIPICTNISRFDKDLYFLLVSTKTFNALMHLLNIFSSIQIKTNNGIRNLSNQNKKNKTFQFSWKMSHPVLEVVDILPIHMASAVDCLEDMHDLPDTDSQEVEGLSDPLDRTIQGRMVHWEGHDPSPSNTYQLCMGDSRFRCGLQTCVGE